MRAARAWCWDRRATSSTSPTARSAAASTPGSRGATRPGRRRAEDDNFMTYCFSTDMQEEDIVFGGEKKLRAAIQEAFDLFHPKAIAVFSTCPVGLIGDDVHAVAPGNEGEAGHQRLRLQLRGLQGREPVGRPPHRQQPLFKHVIGRDDTPPRASSTSACWASTTSAATPSCSKTCSSAAASRWWPRFSGNSTMEQVRERPHRRPERA